MALRPCHSLLRGLRSASKEVQLTQALAAVLGEDPELSSEFVRLVLRASPRSRSPVELDLTNLPPRLTCRAEVKAEEGRHDLVFSDGAGLWKVVVELKIGAGFGVEQVERYLRGLGPANGRNWVVAITRDVPGHGDPGLESDQRWAGVVFWSAIFDRLRELRPRDPEIQSQWPLFFDILEEEGSMGVPHVDPVLMQAWAVRSQAKRHAERFVESLSEQLLESLRDVRGDASGDTDRTGLAGFNPRRKRIQPKLGRQINVNLCVPAGGMREVVPMLWSWENFSFAVGTNFPAITDGEDGVRAVDSLVAAGFAAHQEEWIWAAKRLDRAALEDPDLANTLVAWATDRFRELQQSGILEMGTDGSPSGLPGETEANEGEE